MADVAYTEAHDRMIIALREMAGFTWAQIHIALGRPQGGGAQAVRSRYEKICIRDEAPARSKPKRTVRNCLSCQQPFRSEGAHNRMCDPCREGDHSPFEPEPTQGIGRNPKDVDTGAGIAYRDRSRKA